MDACTIIKPFQKFEVNIVATEKRSSMKLVDIKFNVCDKKPKPALFKAHIFYFNAPTKCPVQKEAMKCVKGSIFKFPESMQKVFPILARNGEIELTFKSEHDTGTSCLKSILYLNKI